MLLTSIVFVLVLMVFFPRLRNFWWVIHMALLLGSASAIDEREAHAMLTKIAIIKTVIFHFIYINIVIFIMYGWDKRSAKKGAWRIPEKTFHTFTLIGGTLGAYVGQKVFNHKKSKKSFRDIYIAIAIAQVIIIYLFYYILN